MKWLLLAAALGALLTPGAASAAPACEAARDWPLWRSYVSAFVSPDGRVIDRTAADRTTSEGQAYALVFALVADDRAAFDRLLSWTRNNLARGDLRRHLPAWHWGRDPRGRWRVLDENAAADADLWLAYALVEAGRLWNAAAHAALGDAVLANVVRREVRTLPGLGPVLLPGPVGFEKEPGRVWRLNPSYLPPQVLRLFAARDPEGPWTGVLRSAERLLAHGAAHGGAPDWVLYDRDRGFVPDPAGGPVASYDAIRVPLWLGMLDPHDPLTRLGTPLSAALRWWSARGYVPERLVLAGERPVPRPAPPGFAAALLPSAAREPGDALARLSQQLEATRSAGLYGRPPAYYDQNLALFGRGFVEGRFRFDYGGRLVPAWGTACARLPR